MDERIFDVTKPDKVKPDATGKPIIVGHHPEVVDPIIRDNAPDKPQAVSDSPTHKEHRKEITPLGSSDELAAAIVPPILTGETVGPQSLAEPKPTEAAVPKPAGATETPSQHSAVSKATSWRPEHPLPISSRHGGLSWRDKKVPLIVAGVILILIFGYFLFGGAIFSGDDDTPATVTVERTPAAPPLTQFQISGTDISFSYPTAWGAATVTKDPGFTKRGGTNQSDGTYAHLVNFAANKDIQVSVTASQYLPAARGQLFYDFQQWCTGTADAKTYKQQLKFASVDGVDTPTTAVCDQGPLDDASKLDESTIFQPKTKNTDGSTLGDLYTKNLSGNDLPVLRVKDAVSTHSEEIKKLLATVKS